MKHCETPLMLAYFMAAYLMASIAYLALTATIGTPFNDSLTERQRMIKKESSRRRSRIFIMSFIVSAILLVMAQPFKQCGMPPSADAAAAAAPMM